MSEGTLQVSDVSDPATTTIAALLRRVLGAGLVSRLGTDDVRAILSSLVRDGNAAAPLAELSADEADRLIALAELVRRLGQTPLERGAPFRDAASVFAHYHATMRELRLEQFRIVLLDGKHRVLREELVSQGTLTSSPVHPREVFALAVRYRAAAVILVHNHPSGDPSPSADDIAITDRLAQAGTLLGIRIVDHIIIGDGTFVSLAQSGLVRL